MNHSEDLMKRLPNDIGGLLADRVQQTDHVLLPWRSAATRWRMCWTTIKSSTPRKSVAGGLGAEMMNNLTYYERWIAAFSVILFQKQILAPDDLARKMAEVEARYANDPHQDT